MPQGMTCRNPVQPCPWKSRAPYGICACIRGKSQHNLRKNGFWQNLPTLENQTPRSSTNQHVVKDGAFFKDLNRNTLILSFPHFHPNQIDSALSLCDYDLSESIGLLRLRSHVLREKALLIEQKNRARAALVNNTNKLSENVKYVPTKYSDVHIVEVIDKSVSTNAEKVSSSTNNNTRIAQVHNTLNGCVKMPSLTIKIEPIFNTTFPKKKIMTAVDPAHSPASASTSSGIHSEDSDKSRDDEPTSSLPVRPVQQKSIKRIGIVLKKNKSGFSAHLL